MVSLVMIENGKTAAMIIVIYGDNLVEVSFCFAKVKKK